MSSQANKTKAIKQQRQAAATTKQLQAAKKRVGSQVSHAQAPSANAKTVLCRSFEQNGYCSYGNRCTYAHGAKELAARTARKFSTPCWYYNQGGCSKSAEECVYQHVLVEGMRKPIHLQHPCHYFHHITPLECRRGEKCGGDHNYELTAFEWKHHFPSEAFPGVGYLTSKPKPVSKTVQVQMDRADFPVLRGYLEPPKALGAWGHPLTVDPPEDPPEDIPKKTETIAPGMLILKKPAVIVEPKAWRNTYVPLCEGGPAWADCRDDEPDPPKAETSPQDKSAPEEEQSIPVPDKSESESELRDQVVKLQGEVQKLTDLLAANQESKMPQMDGELKALITTALKQLLNIP